MKNSITPITDGQIGQMARLVKDSSGVCVVTALRQMRADGELSHEELQLALASGNRLKRKVIPLYKEMIKKLAGEDIFVWEGDLVIPAQDEFLVADHFTTSNPGVKFWDFGSHFKSWFMSMTEKKVGETTAAIGKLRVNAKLADMTPDLGEDRVRTISQLYWMLSQQPRGEKPDGKNRRLLTNGYSNILRVLDKDGIERAVFARWDDDGGWLVNALELEFEDRWDAGGQVVSGK